VAWYADVGWPMTVVQELKTLTSIGHSSHGR